MRRDDIPAIRILPMSDQIDGFRGKTIEKVQAGFFLKRLPTNRGRFGYLSSGLNADAGTIVLFQFQARVIAYAVFLRDEKFEKAAREKNANGKRTGLAGVLWFDPASVRTFEPWDVAAMRRVWPSFRAFGHVKQRLNPGQWPAFKRRLTRLKEA